MKTQTISKKVENLKWSFSFDHEWPESTEETLQAWGAEKVANHAQNAVVIALRAKAESIVKAHVRKLTNTANKDADATFYRNVPADVLAQAITHMQSVMPTAEIPSGERVVLNPVEKAVKATATLSDDEIAEVLKRRGLSVRKAK